MQAPCRVELESLQSSGAADPSLIARDHSTMSLQQESENGKMKASTDHTSELGTKWRGGIECNLTTHNRKWGQEVESGDTEGILLPSPYSQAWETGFKKIK